MKGLRSGLWRRGRPIGRPDLVPRSLRSSETDLRALQTGDDALPDQVPLELCNRREHMEEQPARRCRCVDCLIEDDEIDAEGFQFLRKRDEMVGTPSQTIELRNDEDINTP